MTEILGSQNSELGANVSAPIIFFDGECMLCDGSVQWILSQDRQKRFLFSAQQSEYARAYFAKHARGAMPDSIVLAEGDQLYYCSSAVLRIGLGLGPPWPVFARLAERIPIAVRDLVYRSIARIRYRIFGRRSSCRPIAAKDRDRFLE